MLEPPQVEVVVEAHHQEHGVDVGRHHLLFGELARDLARELAAARQDRMNTRVGTGDPWLDDDPVTDRREIGACIGAMPEPARPACEHLARFRHDHALAKDAVHSELTGEFIKRFAGENNFPVVQSTARDRGDYILFPPKGKRTDENSLEMLKSKCPSRLDVQIVISDGLSATVCDASR